MIKHIFASLSIIFALKVIYYIYVEQYDWNGSPANKFKLDQWGYFTVNEANKKNIPYVNNHDDPFFTYNLP